MTTPTSVDAAEPSGAEQPQPLRARLVARWQRLPVAWRQAIVAALVLRVGLSVLAFVFGGLLPGLSPVSVQPVAGSGFDGWVARSAATQGAGLLGAGLERFDALWYLAIAEDGYPPLLASGGVPGAAAFFPGLPLVVGGLGRLLGGSYFLAGSLVSFGATAAGLAGTHRLVAVETGDPVLARRALVALAVFPSAFFLLSPYTESLFLALSVWAFVLARQGRWAGVVPLALATGLTRNVGVLLALALALEAWRQRGEGSRPTAWTAAGVLAPAAGLAAYVGYGWVRWGSALATVDVQAGWERRFSWPWETLGDAVRFAVETAGRYATGYHSLDLLVALPVLAATVWLVRRVPATYSVYAIAHVLVWLVYPFPQRPLMSTPRFAIVVVPLFWAFAAWTRQRGVATAWWAASAAVLGVMALLFVDWYYVF